MRPPVKNWGPGGPPSKPDRKSWYVCTYVCVYVRVHVYEYAFMHDAFKHEKRGGMKILSHPWKQHSWKNGILHEKSGFCPHPKSGFFETSPAAKRSHTFVFLIRREPSQISCNEKTVWCQILWRGFTSDITLYVEIQGLVPTHFCKPTRTRQPAKLSRTFVSLLRSEPTLIFCNELETCCRCSIVLRH